MQDLLSIQINTSGKPSTFLENYLLKMKNRNTEVIPKSIETIQDEINCLSEITNLFIRAHYGGVKTVSLSRMIILIGLLIDSFDISENDLRPHTKN